MAITTSCFEGRFGLPRGSGSGSPSMADHSCSISAARSPTLRLLSTPGSAFHNAKSRLPLSGAACSSSFDATTISPPLTAAGLAAQRDTITADNVNAHGWVLLLVLRPAAAGSPLTLSSPTEATLLWIIFWRCWAPSEHGIAHPHWGLVLDRISSDGSTPKGPQSI